MFSTCTVRIVNFFQFQTESSALIVAGGLGPPNSGFVSSVEVFLPSRKVWISLGDLQQPRGWYPSLAVFNRKLYCVGGKVKGNEYLMGVKEGRLKGDIINLRKIC